MARAAARLKEYSRALPAGWEAHRLSILQCISWSNAWLRQSGYLPARWNSPHKPLLKENRPKQDPERSASMWTGGNKPSQKSVCVCVDSPWTTYEHISSEIDSL